MGLRFRKSINLGKHFRINLSSKGIGYSYGVKGYRHTVGADGRERITTSIPGTGISNTKYINKKSSGKQNNDTAYQEPKIRESTKEQYNYIKGDVALYAILSAIFILSGIVSYLLMLHTICIFVFGITGIIFALFSIQKRKKCKMLKLQIDNEPKQYIELNSTEKTEITEESGTTNEAEITEESETIEDHKEVENKKTDLRNRYVHKIIATKQIEISESEKDYNNLLTILSNHDEGDYILLYQYEENICFIDNTVKILHGHGGEAVEFIKEPDNPHDKNAIAIYLNDCKIGYIYRGKVQDMVNDWYSRGEPVRGHINKVNVENNRATYKIGFYKPISNYDYRTFKLIYVNKKIDEYSIRSDYLVDCNVGDYVAIRYDIHSGHYYVYTVNNIEIGELGVVFERYSDETDYRIIFGIIGKLDITTDSIICNINVYLI